MSGNHAAEPQVLHALPGRIRIHLPGWSGADRLRVEQQVRRCRGVRHVDANPVTKNVLIRFDPRTTDPGTLLATLGPAGPTTTELPEDHPLPPVVEEEGPGTLRKARIAVRGLERDPRVAPRVLQRLRNLFGVRARASLLTGRVVVEYDEERVDLRELLARVAEVELPDRPGEDRPAHPLDPAPLVHAAARTVGAALGLGLVLFRRLAGQVGSPGRIRRAAAATGVLNLLRSFPLVRNGVRRLFGRHAADLTFSAASVVTLTFSANPLGLLVTGLEGFLLLREVAARRAAWRRHEERLRGEAAAEPGAVIRLKAGARVPLAAEVIEGTGTALGRDGLPRQLSPGTAVSGGAVLAGGPFVLQLQGGKPFLPQPRPAPLAPTPYTRYLHTLGPLSLGYAALTALFTRSLARTFEALLLVNPRPAIIGLESANLDAAGRVLRGGVTVVGTRPDRAIRRPDLLLLDGPRVLTSGLEVANALSLEEELSDAQLLTLAGEISAAAGGPWGNFFPLPGEKGRGQGDFNGLWASGTVGGVRYILGPPEDPPAIGEAVERRHQSGYLLQLSREDDGQALALVALRPCREPRAAGLSCGPAGPADRLEITAVLPLDEGLDDTQVLDLAGGISAAAGFPWGVLFHRAGVAAADGSFNGLWASAAVQGVRYTLGPPEDPPAIGEAVERRHEGGYLLVLSRENDWRPLGFVALRPRLGPGAARLVDACHRLGVGLEMLPAGAPLAARAVARRAGVPLETSTDAVAVIRERQRAGAFVAYVSDSAQAAPGFAACDLAIGLAPERTGDFPARADLLAPDLGGVAAMLEAGVRRDRAVRDAVGFAAVSNVVGAVWGFRGRPGVERASRGVYLSGLAALADGWVRLRGR